MDFNRGVACKCNIIFNGKYVYVGRFFGLNQLPYSGLFLKQKFSQERQKLNFEDCKFRRILISLCVFKFESKMALTISSVVNKKRQCMAIMFIKILCSPE